ncbi:MAG: hypothetical protein GXX94_01160 [Chloroflexi bacterium]|nr:hypothetical protein [Chloroflexota bacterium]
MDLIQVLIRLALVDEEWDDKGRRYQQVRELLGNPRELTDRQEAQAALVRDDAEARAALANLELEMESLQGRLSQVEKDLYGGTISAPRELENLRRDGDQLRHRIAQIEDQALALMAACDDLDVRVHDGAAALEAFESEWAVLTADARETYQTLRARLQDLQSEREQLRQRVPAQEMALYDELRRTKNGRPLAPMRDGICQVCRVSVPRNKITIAEGGYDSVATCEGCGRILYQA